MILKTLLAAILIFATAVPTVGAGSTASLSIYQLDSTWKAQNGGNLRLHDLSGKPRVIAMFYSHCPYMCPQIVSDMKRLQESLTPDARKRIGFVLISIDPKHDSIHGLKAFAHQRGLEPESWTLLSGSSAAVRDLAAALGFRYRETSKGFDHSYLISAVDSDGVIRAQLTQAGPVSQELMQTIDSLK